MGEEGASVVYIISATVVETVTVVDTLIQKVVPSHVKLPTMSLRSAEEYFYFEVDTFLKICDQTLGSTTVGRFRVFSIVNP